MNKNINMDFNIKNSFFLRQDDSDNINIITELKPIHKKERYLFYLNNARIVGVSAVAQIDIAYYKGDIFLHDFIVYEESFRNRGIGTCFMKKILKELKRFENGMVKLQVEKENYKAINLYKRLGFEITQEFNNSYEMGKYNK